MSMSEKLKKQKLERAMYELQSPIADLRTGQVSTKLEGREDSKRLVDTAKLTLKRKDHVQRSSTRVATPAQAKHVQKRVQSLKASIAAKTELAKAQRLKPGEKQTAKKANSPD